MRARDTSPEVHRMQLERMRAMSSAERAEQGARLCRSARELMRAGIRSRHPEYDPETIELALLRLVLADDVLFRAAKPGTPLPEP
ncbi:MAG: hypothetical protein IAG13_04165 [Deltaproteobacteria bacterium]|nr:hypothetical protein [Nannocystaceae bacterium]